MDANGSESSASARRVTIVLADDELSLRNIIGQGLQALGHRVLYAADGYEVLELIGNSVGRIDLVITDVDMPRFTGKQLHDYLIKEKPCIKLIMMSGYLGGDFQVPVLRKPFSLITMLSKVHEVLKIPLPPQCINE